MHAGARAMLEKLDRSASRMILVMALLALAMGGCSRSTDDGTVSLSSLPLWGSEEASSTPDPEDAEQRIARAIWAVVPDAPPHKPDPEPSLIRGSAVAVAADTLLASCGSVGARGESGLLRRSSYRLAPRVATDPD